MPDVALIAHSLMLLALGLLLFALGHLLLSALLRPARLSVELFQKDNPALGVAVAGYDLGLVIAFGSALLGESRTWLVDLANILEFGLGSILLYAVCVLIARFVLIGRMGLVRELTEDRNLGLGFTVACYWIASGITIHGLMSGQGGGWLPLAVFFALAQLILLGIGPVYQRIARYDLRKQLRDHDNAAAGLAYGGCLLGMGTILGQLLAGDFTTWGPALGGFAIYTVGALVALPLIRWLTDLILAPGVKLSHEIATADQAPNLAAGLIEGVSYVAAGLLVAWSVV